MPVQVKAFACQFCPKRRRLRISRKSVENHERTCFWNPERHACATCKHFSHGKEEFYTLEFGESVEHPYRTNECAIDLIPYTKEDRIGKLQHECEGWEPNA